MLAIGGTYTQGSGGVLNINIGGSTAGSGYGQLNVTGAAALAGTLNITTVNGFGPTKGQTFSVLNYASETGDFTTVNGLKSGYQTLFLRSVNPNSVSLDAAQDAPDLSLQTLTFPTTGTSGQTITLNYTVQNLNATGPRGAWQDSFFISPDPVFDASAILLGVSPVTGGIAANGSYTAVAHRRAAPAG